MGDPKKHANDDHLRQQRCTSSTTDRGLIAETVAVFVEREVRPMSTEAITNGDLPLDADHFRSASATELTR